MTETPLTILFVEDQVRHRRIYEAAITEALPAKVTFAVTGDEALAIMNSATPPDMVILDLELPGIRGDEVLVRIKTNQRLRYTPVIILTGHADLATQMQLLRGGADDFIEKSGPPSVLMARIRAQMRHKVAIDRLERLAIDRDLFAAGVLADISASKGTITSLCHRAQAAIAADPVANQSEILAVYDQLSAHATQLGSYAVDVIQSVRETQREPQMAAQSIAEALAWVAGLFAPAGGAPAGQFEFHWQAPAALAPVLADRSFLRLAVFNIVQHAQHRVSDGQALRLLVSQNPLPVDDRQDLQGRRMLVTRFRDYGPTPRGADLEHAFTPSLRGEGLSDGQPLGLALVAKVVARMGGEVWAEAAEGGGMVYCLALPHP